MSIWPAGLPQKPQVSGFVETPPETTIRTQMDAGVAKVRRRFTAGARNITAIYEMTTAQIATFETFYTTTIKGGSLAFDLPDPRTGSTVSARITNVPQYRSIGGEYWSVPLAIEVLP